MGIARSFIAMAALGLVTASCESEQGRQDPTYRPATYGDPQSFGGATNQWSLLITVDALGIKDDNWYAHQRCTSSVAESTRRQRLFADRIDAALTDILSRNAHCAVAALAPLTYGGNGCSEARTANPSGVYAVFSCTNSEPLNTTRQ